MKRLLIIMLFFVAASGFFVSAVYAADITINTQIPGKYPNDPVGIVANLYNFALMIAGLLAFGAIVYGAIKYTISAGNPTQQSDAKQWITDALLGLLLLAGSFIILQTINPDLTTLRLAPLDKIGPPPEAGGCPFGQSKPYKKIGEPDPSDPSVPTPCVSVNECGVNAPSCL